MFGYGTYGKNARMVKTTIYLPEELKVALELEAARTNTSEADLVRSALTRMLGVSIRQWPRFGEFTGESLSVEKMDDALVTGFGER